MKSVMLAALTAAIVVVGAEGLGADDKKAPQYRLEGTCQGWYREDAKTATLLLLYDFQKATIDGQELADDCGFALVATGPRGKKKGAELKGLTAKLYIDPDVNERGVADLDGRAAALERAAKDHFEKLVKAFKPAERGRVMPRIIVNIKGEESNPGMPNRSVSVFPPRDDAKKDRFRIGFGYHVGSAPPAELPGAVAALAKGLGVVRGNDADAKDAAAGFEFDAGFDSAATAFYGSVVLEGGKVK